MNWQLAIVIVLVGAAVAYLVRSSWRTWSAKTGCGGGCGCTEATPAADVDRPILIPREALRLKPRHPPGPAG
jgi:hypothetical protein